MSKRTYKTNKAKYVYLIINKWYSEWFEYIYTIIIVNYIVYIYIYAVN